MPISLTEIALPNTHIVKYCESIWYNVIKSITFLKIRQSVISNTDYGTLRRRFVWISLMGVL